MILMSMKTTPLKEQVYEAIRAAILEGKLDKETVYSAQWFADHFGISRTPVREALLRLEREGLVDIRSNYGVVIKKLTLQDAWRVYQVRAAIDGYCAYYLAKHFQEEQAQRTIRRMGDLMESCRQNFNRQEEMQFHIEPILFTENTELLDEFNRIRARVDIYWSDVVTYKNRCQDIYYEHGKILECIKVGDAAGAFSASEEHMHITYELVKEGGLFLQTS